MSLERSIADIFATSRPSDAAHVLEDLSESDVREFLGGSDLQSAAAVVDALTPLVASRCLALSSPSRAAEILTELPLARAADLLRGLESEQRDGILSLVSKQSRRPIEKMLRFPAGTAGSMMAPRVESFREGLTVEATLSRLRRPAGELRYYLYVVNDDLVLTGVASLRQLVAAPVDATMRSVMTQPAESLSARAGVSAILDHPGWRRFPVLPVVDESGILVGIFRYETFRKLQERSESEDASPLDVALALGELFWLGASGLLRGLEGPMTVPGASREEKEASHG